MMVFC